MKKSMSGKQAQNPIIEVKEEFMPYGGRLKEIIGIKMSVEGFMVYVGKNGDILLRPSVSVPSSEAWIYENPGVIGSVRKGLQEAGEGKLTRVNDIASFLKKL
jgi:hypothetical protein